MKVAWECLQCDHIYRVSRQMQKAEKDYLGWGMFMTNVVTDYLKLYCY